MKPIITISLLEKACTKIDAIVARIPLTSDRASINLAVKEVIADLETAIIEIKNIDKQRQLQEKENLGILKEREQLKPASSQI